MATMLKRHLSAVRSWPCSLCAAAQQADTSPGGSIIVKQVGHAILTVTLTSGEKEEYLITLPRLRIDGLWYGSPYIELADTSYIQGSNGWQSVVRSLSMSPSTTLIIKC